MLYTVGKLLISTIQLLYIILQAICHKATNSLYFPVTKISCFTVYNKSQIISGAITIIMLVLFYYSISANPYWYESHFY